MTNREARDGRRLGWLVVGVLSAVTAGWGLLDPGIYLGLIAPATRPGAFSQDVIAVVAAIVLAPVMFVLGAVLIFSLALGELVKPAFDAPITMAGLVPPTLLTVLFVGFGGSSPEAALLRVHPTHPH
jgi:hypothetical protein